MNKYFLPELDLSEYSKLYCGNETRLATATSVSFVNYNKIIVPSLLGKTMYLIDISDNGFKIINQLYTGVYSDLTDYRNGLIISSNALSPKHPDGTISVYSLVDNNIIFIKDFKIKDKLRIHGCRFLDNSNILVASNDKNDSGLYFVNLETNQITKYIKFDLKVKDMYVLGDRLFVITSQSAPTKNGGYIDKNSILYLYKLSTMEKLDELIFDGQVDSICVINNNGFITVQGKHSLFQFGVTSDKLTSKKYISGFSFPHGIATMDDRVIITNYGDNSVDIYDIEELIKD